MVDRGIALSFLDLGARRGWVLSTTPRPLYPRERSGTHCTGGWVGPRAGLDVCEKSCPPPGFFYFFKIQIYNNVVTAIQSLQPFLGSNRSQNIFVPYPKVLVRMDVFQPRLHAVY